MVNIPDARRTDEASSWRELADALTPAQVAYLEDWERRPGEPPTLDGSPRPWERHAAALLHAAREYVEQNSAAVLFGDVAPPAGADEVFPWEFTGETWERYFVEPTRPVGDAEVFVSGHQTCGGTVTRSIAVNTGGNDFDAARARKLAAAILAAADDLDGSAR